MKTNLFDRLEWISYSFHILLPFMLLKSKYVEFTNLKMKIKADYVPTTNTNNKIYKTTCHP